MTAALAPARPAQLRRVDLGALLLARGAIDRAALQRARLIGQPGDVPLDRVLVTHGLADPGEVTAALATAHGLDSIDLDAAPPEPGLAGEVDLSACLNYRIVPWRRVGGMTVYATSRPATADAALARLAGTASAFVVLAEDTQIERAILAQFGQRIAGRSAVRTPAPFSVRALGGARQGMLVVLAAGALASIATVDGALAGLGFLLLAVSLATTTTRLLSLLASRADHRPAPALAGIGPLPKISVLVPLFREAAMLPKIVAALEATDYPRESLEALLLLEEDDEATRAAVGRVRLPPWIRPLVVPAGAPRTKPRAMNAALDFCAGDIVGVLDAEDIPDPGQFRAVAAHLAGVGHQVASVQCQLAYYNARENWITRCFQIEYAIWFDVLLRGWQRLGLPLPLGGTSVYFRRQVLVELGGWDAHNVTEDADLGMRLARHGYRCDVLGTTTWEEANGRVWPWIRQRSRWLKGYMMTWLSHMRAPGRLWRELGPAGFMGFQVLFLGGAATYLAMPMFWIALAAAAVSDHSIYGDAMPGWALWTLAASLVTGQAVMIGSAALALWRRRALDLLLWVPLLLLYWTMGAVAAWKAIVEIGPAPYYWDKTRHGVSRIGRRFR